MTPITKLVPFQFNNPKHSRQNILLKNIGNLEFVDVTIETNAGGNQNTFTATFVDFGSGWPDLVLAHDIGRIEILRNINGKFTPIDLSHLPYGFWMGIAIGDINNNGRLDLFFSNLGTTLPAPKTGGVRGNPNKGGLRPDQQLTNKHLMLRNDGNYKFTNISDEAGITNSGFGWGAVFHDVNLSGDLDLLFAQNYILFKHQILLPGAYYIGNGKGKFKRKLKYMNKNYGQTPVLIDLNSNGITDIAWVNMVGPVKGYLIDKKNNDFFNVKLPEVPACLNATVTITYKVGSNPNKIIMKSQTRQYIVGGIGFGGDNRHTISFGLCQYVKTFKKIDVLTVKTIYGPIMTFKNLPVNSTAVIDRNHKLTMLHH
jgi:hypothetical protein